MLLEHPDIGPLFKELQNAGHTVDTMDNLDYDFVAGPNCWYCIPEVAGLFGHAVKVAERGKHEDKARAVQSSVKDLVKRESAKRVRTSRKAKSSVGVDDSGPAGATAGGE